MLVGYLSLWIPSPPSDLWLGCEWLLALRMTSCFGAFVRGTRLACRLVPRARSGVGIAQCGGCNRVSEAFAVSF